MIALLATYLIGRMGEINFKKSYGFNAYLWKPFDSYLRLIIARRNPILVILTAGFFLQAYEQSYHVAALWAILTIAIQIFRLALAKAKARKGETISIFLQDPA